MPTTFSLPQIGAVTGLSQNHISYQSESVIKQMIAPLTKLAGIEYFCYGVNYPDSSGFTLHSNSRFYESWFENTGTLRGFYLQEGWHLFDDLLPQNVLNCAHSQDLGNFITYIEHQQDKTIIFEFGTRCDNNKAQDYYIENLGFLKRFGQHFVSSLAKDLVHHAENQRITPYPSMMEGETKGNTLFINPDISLIEQLNDNEKLYLHYLLQGYSQNDIAEVLNISAKTICAHLAKLHKKFNCRSKSEFFYKLQLKKLIHYYLNECDESMPSDLKKFVHNVNQPISKLSPQELRCYKLILMGYKLREISKELNIAVSTIADYVTRLKHKLNAKNNIELFLQAIENDFLVINKSSAT